jgi:hypothetical protein
LSRRCQDPFTLGGSCRYLSAFLVCVLKSQVLNDLSKFFRRVSLEQRHISTGNLSPALLPGVVRQDKALPLSHRLERLERGKASSVGRWVSSNIKVG